MIIETYPGLQQQQALITAQWKAFSAGVTSADSDKNGLGWQDPKVFDGLSEFLVNEKVITQAIPSSESMTNEHLSKK